MILVLHSSKKATVDSVIYNPKPGFVTLGTVDILGQIILHWGGIGIVLHHPGFYPLAVSAFPAVTAKND